MKTTLGIGAVVSYDILTVAESQALTQPKIETIYLTELVRPAGAQQDVFATRCVQAKPEYAAAADPTVETDLSFLWFADDYMRWEPSQEGNPLGFVRAVHRINSTRRLKADDWDCVYTIKNGSTSGGSLEFVISVSCLVSVS